MSTSDQLLSMITKPLFTCPQCMSQSVVAVATRAGVGNLWLDLTCRACGLCEIDLVYAVETEPAIVTRWLAVERRNHAGPDWDDTYRERTCPQSRSRHLVFDEDATGSRCPFCAAPSRIWN
jgi:hypothetical protein